MSNIIDFKFSKSIQERRKKEIITMVIDKPNMEPFFKAFFEHYLLNTPSNYFKNKEHLIRTIFKELVSSTDIKTSTITTKIT